MEKTCDNCYQRDYLVQGRCIIMGCNNLQHWKPLEICKTCDFFMYPINNDCVDKQRQQSTNTCPDWSSNIKLNPNNKTAPKNHLKENKLQMSLMPLDLLSELLCPAYEEGVKKYERESWRLGFNISTMHDALLRHLNAFIYDKENYDSEYPKKHHLGALIFCAICMYDTIKNHEELDDR